MLYYVPTLNAGDSLGELLDPEEVVEDVLAGLLRLPSLLGQGEPPGWLGAGWRGTGQVRPGATVISRHRDGGRPVISLCINTPKNEERELTFLSMFWA